MSNIGPLRSRPEIAALLRGIADAEGNKDGILGNEGRAANTTEASDWVERQPFVARVRSAIEPGLSVLDEGRRLERFLEDKERAWSSTVTELPAERLADLPRFRFEKAIALVRFDRHPKDVTEGFVEAKGSVDGEGIAPRDVFWQRWKPTGEPNGTVVVVSPGFMQTGRSFLEQVQAMNRQGYDVVVMDHQWAGNTWGRQGGIDRGFGVARDVAAVAAFANALADREYEGRPHQVVLVGTSMGGSAGVFSAAVLNDAGKMELDGTSMPKGVSMVLQSPFFEATPSVLNRVLSAAGTVPGLKDLAVPALGLPILTRDPVTLAKTANHTTREGIVSRLQAFGASSEDLLFVKNLVESGWAPRGRVYFIQAENDPLASPEASRTVCDLLGDKGRFESVPGEEHLLESSVSDQHRVLDALRWVTEPKRG